MGSDESHFNVSLIVRDKVTRQCPETTIFEEKGEPKWIQTEVPLLTYLTVRPDWLTGGQGVGGHILWPCVQNSGSLFRCSLVMMNSGSVFRCSLVVMTKNESIGEKNRKRVALFSCA